MGPAALLNSLVSQIIGVPNGPNISVISGRRWLRIGILGKKLLVLLSRITLGIFAFRLLRTLPCLCVGTQSSERSRSQSSGAYSQDTPSGNSVLDHPVFRLIAHRFSSSMVNSTIFVLCTQEQARAN